MYYHSNIYIEFNIFKLLRYWWIARKYFLAPDIVKHKLNRGDSLGEDYYYLNTDVNNKWIHLSFESCCWKDKFGEVRFEAVPYVLLVIFNKVWVWGFEAPLYEQYKGRWSRNNLLYWESILGYSINYEKDIIKTYKNNIWYREYYSMYKPKDKEEPKRIKIEETCFNALTNKGKKKILEYQKSLGRIEKYNNQNDGS